MNKNFISCGAFGLVAMLTACSATPKGYTVTGTLSDSTMNGKTVYILDMDKNAYLDTAVVSNNTFVFEGKADTAVLASLMLEGQRYPLAWFALENGNISIDSNWEAKGTLLNEELTRVTDTLSALNTAYNEAYKAFEGSREEWNAVSENEWIPKFKQCVLDSYKGHTDDPVGYNLLTFLGVMDSDEQLELVNTFGPWLSATNKVSTLKANLEGAKATAVGQPYVDVKGTDINGNPVALSDFVGKGNYVLVDMWASWCGPCKREIPNLANLHNLYKDKGLTVIGIYVWDKLENLAPAMEKEGITWPQIIDTEDRAATKAYGVQGIPCIMLIGPDGTILDRTNLRGENMQPTVEKFMFGNK